MDDSKNLWLAVALSILVLLGWTAFESWRAPDAPPPGELTQSDSGTGATTVEGGDTLTAPVMPGATGGEALPVAAAVTRDAALAETPRLPIQTPRLRGSINLAGARLDDLTLLDYGETPAADSPRINLLHPAGGNQPYYAEFGWAAAPGTITPNAETLWQADAAQLTPETPVTLSWQSPQGLLFRQQISIDDNYMLRITQSVENNGTQSALLSPFGLVSRTGTPPTLDFYILHEGLIGFLDGGLEEIDYEDLRDEPGRKMNFESTGGWMGITDKYWLVALAPDQEIPVSARFQAAGRGTDDLYQVDFLSEPQTLAPNAAISRTSHLFAGAKETLLLDDYRDRLGIANFDLAVDFGWFYFLTKPIFYAINWLNSKLLNFGLAILALTVLIKLALFPLANKSYASMSRMKLLQPKMLELRERYGDDKVKLNQEMMALYKKEKVSPLSGCLPILVQIPIFFALYKVLFVTIEMRHAPFYGWIDDLSAPDPLGVLTGFGLFDWQVPAILLIVNIGLWPLIMGLTMWMQQKLNPAPTDPIQQKIFLFMPIIFTFLLAQFPAGLVIYWAWNNILSILQQYVIMRRMGVAIGGGKAGG